MQMLIDHYRLCDDEIVDTLLYPLLKENILEIYNKYWRIRVFRKQSQCIYKQWYDYN